MTADQAAKDWSRAIWIDAQLPPSLARWLVQAHGVDAHHVLEIGFIGADDAVIFEAARSGKAAVVVTKDEDFVQLLEHRGPPPQIVWVTCGNVRNETLREIVDAAWPRVAELIAAGEPRLKSVGAPSPYRRSSNESLQLTGTCGWRVPRTRSNFTPCN